MQKDSNLILTEEQALAQFNAIDKDGNGVKHRTIRGRSVSLVNAGSIDFHEWLDSLDLQQLGRWGRRSGGG